MERAKLLRQLLELNENERQFKEGWKTGSRDLYEKGMTFSQYEEYLREGRCIDSCGSHYYRDMSQDHLGTTVIEPENKITMTLHQRYGYPVFHNHAYIEIVYVYSGECAHFVEEKRFLMKKGDFCILAPHAMHAVSATADDAIVMNVMLSRQVLDGSFLELLRGGRVTVRFFEDLFYKKELVSPCVIFPTGDDEQIRGLLEQMYEEVTERQYAYERSLYLLIQSVFIRLIRKYEMQAVVTTPTETSFNTCVVSVLGYLSVNYNRTTLNETADFFKYTPDYLGKMLKRYTGRTYREIVLEYQLEHGKELLEKSDRSVTDISQEVGCFDASHFTKKFRKKYGISPTEFRKRYFLQGGEKSRG